MNNLKTILTKDLGWKLFSVIVAVIMWFAVINIENPIETRTITSYIEIQNADTLTALNKTILNLDEIENTKITIRIRGKRITLDRFVQNKSISAYIDISDIGENISGNEIVVPIRVRIPSVAGETINAEYINPSSVTLRIDELVSKVFTVKIIKTGNEAPDKTIDSLIANPETITVYGPSTELEKVAQVQVTVDVTNLNENTGINVESVAVDSAGNRVGNVFLSSKSVSVAVNLHNVKTIPVITSFTGVAADGYTVKSIKAVPEEITITGETEVLNSVSSIDINSVNIFGRTESFTTDIYVGNYLPEGITVKGNSQKIRLEVTIEKQAEKQIEIKAEDIALTGLNNDEYTAEITGATTMTVRGEDEAMDTFDSSALRYTADLTGLGVGSHVVNVDYQLPQGIFLYGDRPVVTVTITQKETDASSATNGEQLEAPEEEAQE